MNNLQQRIRRRAYSQDHLSSITGLHPVLQRVYAARAVTDASDLSTELDQLLPYHSLQDVDLAMARLVPAVTQGERILIIGDFDTDGATSSVLAIRALSAFGAKQVDYLVPNRFDYGYGLTPEIVDVARERQPDLIITVDNGIASHAGVDRAREYGIDVIITDHHLPSATLPNAVAIVNPNRVDDQFDSKNLAGVGVIFYVMLALRRALSQQDWFTQQAIPEPNMAQFLDLVALGTVADVVPLDRNNRILVAQGLRRIRVGKCRLGISALLGVAKRLLSNCVASDLGYAVAPRLNAAGRLEDISLGIECLLADDMIRAQTLARELDQLNQTRQLIEADMQQQAMAVLEQLRIDESNLPAGICLFDEDWHQGISGIVAGRLKERYFRPTIIFAKSSESELKGSARSIPGVHIRDLLENIASHCPGLITKFGGHAMAAGLSLPIEHFSDFSQVFAKMLTQLLTPELTSAEIFTDGQLLPPQLSLELAEAVRAGGPWGQHFPEPVFDGTFKVLSQHLVGEKHLKLSLALTKSDIKIDAIAFNIDLTQWPNLRCKEIFAVYRLDVNEYQGWRTLQLVIETMEATHINSV